MILKIKIDKLRPGGTNTPILFGENKNGKIVIKQYGFEPFDNKKSPRLSRKSLSLVVNDYLKIRSIVEKSLVNIPTLVEYYFVDDHLKYNSQEILKSSDSQNKLRLVLVEGYTGKSLKDLVAESTTNSSEIERYLIDVKKVIARLPEGVPLDVNPANFTVLNDTIFFIDFMPPLIYEYQNNSEIVDLFPQIKIRPNDREYRRKNRYYTTNGRIERFLFYLDLLTQKPQNTQKAETQ